MLQFNSKDMPWFIELEPFTEELFALCDGHITSPELYRKEVQNELIDNPQRGAVIRGTGGIRKMRCKTRTGGKSGGLRVLYLYIDHMDSCYLIDVWEKADKESLTREEKNQLRAVTKRIKQKAKRYAKGRKPF